MLNKYFASGLLIVCLVAVPFFVQAQTSSNVDNLIQKVSVLVKQLEVLISRINPQKQLGLVTSTDNVADFNIKYVVEAAPVAPHFLQVQVCNNGSKSLNEMGFGASLNFSAKAVSNSSFSQTAVWSGGTIGGLKRGACGYGSMKITNENLKSEAGYSNAYILKITPNGFTDPNLNDNVYTFVRSGGVYISQVVNRPAGGKDSFWITACNDAPKTLNNTAPFYMVLKTGDQYDAFDMNLLGSSGLISSSKGMLANMGGTRLQDLGFGTKDGLTLKTCNNYLYVPNNDTFKSTFSSTKKMGVMLYPKVDYVEPTLFDNMYIYNQNSGETSLAVSTKTGYNGLSEDNKNIFLSTLFEVISNSNLTGNENDANDDSISFLLEGNIDYFWLMKLIDEYESAKGIPIIEDIDIKDIRGSCKKLEDDVKGLIVVRDLGKELLFGKKKVVFNIRTATNPNSANFPFEGWQNTKFTEDAVFIHAVGKSGVLIKKNVYRGTEVVQVISCEMKDPVILCSYTGKDKDGKVVYPNISARQAAIIQYHNNHSNWSITIEPNTDGNKKGKVGKAEFSCAGLTRGGGTINPTAFGDLEKYRERLIPNNISTNSGEQPSGTFWESLTEVSQEMFLGQNM